LPDLWNDVLIILFLILINAFFAGSEIALVTLRNSRVKQLVKQGSKSARAVDFLLKDPSRLLATIQVGVTLAGFLASAAAAVGISVTLADILRTIPFLERYAQGIAVIIVTVVISFITLVLGELAPKRLAMQKSEKISLAIARPLLLLSKAAGPFIALLTLSTNFVVKLLGGEIKHREPKLSEEEIRLLVAEQGTLNEEEKEMIEGIFEFGDTVAREVMVPRTEMISFERSLKVDQALEKVIQYGFSRYPVYERNIDNVIGIVTIKDLLHANKVNRDKVEIIKVMRDVFFIPESKNVLDLLKELQVRRMNMAVVLDEYGGTAGLVTIEDLLEEIVGDINDEYDKVTVPIEIISENHGIFDGKILVEDVNDSLNLDLPMEEGYDTVAGLVFHCLGKIPRKGDWVELDGIAVKVKEMEGNRIKKVEVIREKPPAETPAPIEE